RKYPFLINQDQIDDALRYHGSSEHPRFWSQSVGFWPQISVGQTVLDERIVLNNGLKEPAIWYTNFQWCAALDPSFEGGDRKVFEPFKLGTLSEEDHNKWQIEFAQPVELKISVRSEEEIHLMLALLLSNSPDA